MATAAQVKQFINTIAPIAVKVCKERGYGNAQAWTCVAQACCESAYGTATIMKNANAFFGIKASSRWVKAAKYGGKVYNAATKECYDGKTYTNIKACFRAYDNMEDSVRDYFDLIEGARYKASLTKGTVLEAITCIKNGGYATSPVYISTISTIFEKNKAEITKYTVTGKVEPQPTRPTRPTRPTTAPATQEALILKIAKEVIRGKWGNGSERKRRLTQAGYDYRAVQRKVNELMK